MDKNYQFFSKLNVNINKIINEPARLKIMTILYVVENAEFNYLLQETGLTKGNMSSHIAKLELANYVRVNKDYVNKIPRTIIGIIPSGRYEYEIYRKCMLKLLKIVT